MSLVLIWIASTGWGKLNEYQYDVRIINYVPHEVLNWSSFIVYTYSEDILLFLKTLKHTWW